MQSTFNAKYFCFSIISFTSMFKPDSFMTRKNFLKQSSLSLLGFGLLFSGVFQTGAGNAGAAEAEADGAREEDFDDVEGELRSITYNVFNGCIGYKGINSRELPPGEESALIRSARDLGQIPQRIMLELALYRPNIINFSESPGEEVVKEMAKISNLNHAFFPGRKDGKGNYPGSILSTYKIISSENRPFVGGERGDSKKLFTRHWGKAKLQLPNGKTVTVHTAHLWPFKKSENDTRIRLNEIKELVASIKYDLAHGSDSVLLQGDLNQVPNTPEYESLKRAGLIDTFAAKGIGVASTIDSRLPLSRIDYIFAIGDLANRIKSCTSLFQGNFRMNMNDPKGFALSDHLPVLAKFEL